MVGLRETWEGESKMECALKEKEKEEAQTDDS